MKAARRSATAVREIETDLCVIGAGSGGLSVAAGAVQMGARVVLVERGAMGGDCLNVGCVPSKALIAAARAADTIRRAGRFGLAGQEPKVDFAAVHEHVRDVIAQIAPTDSVERFEGLGVTVLQAEARFAGPDRIVADGTAVRAKRFVIATGSTAAVPPIEGLARVPYLTNETLFDLTVLPDRLVVVGGGPIGLEMAQAHARLGSRVTVLERDRLLPREDGDLTAPLRAARSPATAWTSSKAQTSAGWSRAKASRSGAERCWCSPTAPGSAGSPRPTCWSPRAAARWSTRSTWRRPASRSARPGSRSTPGCAPRTGGSSRSATWRAGRSSPISPATTPGS